MPDNALRETDLDRQGQAAGTAAPTINVVFLPNVKMSVKRTAVLAEEGPDARRGEEIFQDLGVSSKERDLHSFPWNPLAKKGTLLAGLDFLRALKVLLCDRKADVIVSVFESNVFFILLLRKFFRFQPKIVLWEVSGRGWALRDRILDYVVPRVDHVFVLTEDQRSKVEAHYKLRNPAKVLGFAIDDEFFRSASGSVDERYVLAVGDDVSRDYPTLVEACRLAGLPLKLRSNAKFALPENASHVSFVGRLSYKELRRLYQGASIVVVPLKPADYPGGITAVYESMSMGKPLIVSRTTMTAGFITHGEDGIFVNPGDPLALSEELTALWNDTPKAASIGRAARAKLEREFSYDQYIRRFALLLRQAAES